MEENVSLWNKTQEDLTVADQLKVMVIAPAFAAAVIFVPLFVFGKTVQILERRKLKKQTKLSIVEDATEE